MEIKILKLELILAQIYLPALIELMAKYEIHGYTAFNIASSKGIHHGEQHSEGLMPANQNTYLFSVVSESAYNAVKPELNRFISMRGGAVILTEVIESTNVKINHSGG